MNSRTRNPCSIRMEQGVILSISVFTQDSPVEIMPVRALVLVGLRAERERREIVKLETRREDYRLTDEQVD